ncbi:PIN domain-containing protein [bacterium]|nr:PIN domain-containing protein [bacterium]
MSYRYLLDTNIISDLIRNPQGAAFQQISRVGEASVCTSIVVACEMRYGARKKRATRLQERLDGIFLRIDVLPLASPIEAHYAEIRTLLEQSGTPIGPNDLLLAAHALALNLTLVTANIREFERVPNLQVVNWL